MPSLLPEIPSPLPETAEVALEWPRLREHLAGRTSSPLGRAWVLSLQPSADLAWIDAQHSRSADLLHLLEGGASFSFAGLFDPTDALAEARIEGAALEPLQLLAIQTLAERITAWRQLLLPEPGGSGPEGRGRNAFSPPGPGTRDPLPAITALSAPLLDGPDLSPLIRSLRGKIEPDGTLADDASPELRRLRRAAERQHSLIQEGLRRAARALREEGATTTDANITVRGERFVIPVRAEWKRRVPGVIHGASSTGQTVFVEPLETIAQNNELAAILEDEQAEIHRILVALTRAVAGSADTVALGTAILAEVESHWARAKFSRDLRCVRPTFFAPDADPDRQLSPEEPAPSLILDEARHPLLELRMRAEPRASAGEDAGGQEASPGPVPLTLHLSSTARELIVSGPNTGGKTVSLKTLGLLSLMAQAGVPVPAARAHLPLFSAVFADIGDAQSIERNLSSFSAHITNLDRITRRSSPSSLVLLDELGSATDPEEGAALAVAIAARFLALGAWTAITTHLTALKVFAADRPGVANAAVGFDPETLSPTYTLRLGVPGASAGLNIAARLGLDPAIIQDARAGLTTQTADIGALLDRLHAQLAEVTAEREDLRRRAHEVRTERERLDREGRAEQKARTRELEQKLETLLGSFDKELRDTVKAIDDKTVAQKIARDAALRTARLRREFSEQFRDTVLAHTTGADRSPGGAAIAGRRSKPAPRPTAPGDLVRLRSLGREARVSRVLDGQALEVEIGQMKMRVPLSDVVETTPVAVVPPAEAARRRGNITVQTTQTADFVPLELNVIGRRAEEAEDEVARYIDQAFLAGLPRVRIVHGTGMGVLRRTLRDYLRKHPHVTAVTEPPHNEGGQGATVVDLRQ